MEIPSIITANTFYWKPQTAADSRRRKESQHLATVKTFLTNLGFTCTLQEHSKSVSGQTTFQGKLVEVHFTYRESTKNVYKSFTVWYGGKNSNITIVKKMVAALLEKI